MPIVTRLEPEKSRPHRTSVYLDGAFAFAVESRLALGLQVGAELTVAEVTALERRQAVDTALADFTGSAAELTEEAAK